MVLKRFLTIGTLVAAFVLAAPFASADTKKPAAKTTKVDKKLEFVISEKDGQFEQMRVKGVGGADEGYIEYEHPGDSKIVSIHGVKGVKGVPGIGEALKKELLRRFPAKSFKSQLVNSNYKSLLEAWEKSNKSSSSYASLRAAVPAMKFDGFDYALTCDASKTGGQGFVSLVMTPGKGRVTIDKPGELTKMLKSK